MRKMTRKETSTIFKARARMLDIKNNFKNKYATLHCRKCNEEIETQEHIFETCRGIHTTEETKIYTEDIFGDNTEKLQTEAKKILDIMDKLHETTTDQMCSSLNEGLSELVTQLRTQ